MKTDFIRAEVDECSWAEAIGGFLVCLTPAMELGVVPRLERFDIIAHQARDGRSVFGPDGFGDADLGDLHLLVVDCLALHYSLRTTGSIKVGSLFFTFPTRVLTGQQVISSAR